MQQMHGDLFSFFCLCPKLTLMPVPSLLVHLSSNTRTKYFPTKLDNFAPKRKKWQQNIYDMQERSVSPAFSSEGVLKKGYPRRTPQHVNKDLDFK